MYKILLNGGAKSFTPSWSQTLSEGTTFSALSEQQGIFSSVVITDGKLVVTPNGTNTGNAYISIIASMPNGKDAAATILVHVTDDTTETEIFGNLTPV